MLGKIAHTRVKQYKILIQYVNTSSRGVGVRRVHSIKLKLSPSVAGLLLTLVILASVQVQPALSQFPPEGNVVVLPQSISMLYGNDFTLDVQAQGVLNMTWISFHMNFTNFVNLIRLDSYTLATGWSGGGAPEKPGYWGFSAGRAAFNGTSTVFTVTFHCLAGGDSSIAIEDAEWRKYGGYSVYFVQLGMATVSQVLPSTVTETSSVTTTSTYTTVSTTTTTTSSVSTTISPTTTVVTSWGHITLSGTTTITNLVTSVLTSVITSVGTTGGSTVTSTLTSMWTTTIRTTSTATGVTTVASPITITETTTGTQSFEPRPLPSGCMIATAAYGSELAPDVAYMRYVRDELIGSSLLGSSLVTGFNAFYYSWSPALAEWIAGNALLMAVFRVLLLPLAGIVHVTALVFTATAHATGQTDAASLFSFLAAAIMTVTVYVLLPILAAAKSRHAIRRLRARFRSQIRHLNRIG